MMSAEEYESQLAELRRELADVKLQRDRLLKTAMLLFPEPTPAQLAAAEANVGGFRRLIDQMATKLGVARDGR